MHRNYCFRLKRHSCAACDDALAASHVYICANITKYEHNSVDFIFNWSPKEDKVLVIRITERN